LIFRPGDRITVKAVKPTRMMFPAAMRWKARAISGGIRLLQQGRIEQAKQDWKTGRFAHVPQEHEFIPLPD